MKISLIICLVVCAAVTNAWLFKGRKRDETGHRTGLGTIGKNLVSNPIKTIKTGGAFVRNYIDMRRKNTIGYDKIAHENANYQGTKIGGEKLAGAFSAVREYGKVLKGDRRSPAEIKSDMDANRRGRERARGEGK